MNIHIVGVGGTASHLIQPLVNYYWDSDPVFHLWDADHVEEKNLARQGFYGWEVGRHKVDAIADRYDGLERVTMITYREYLGGDRIAESIRDEDVVFICADNMKVRALIDEHAATLDNIVVINGGNEEWSGSVQAYVKIAGREYSPRISFNSPEFDNVSDPDMAELSCAEIAELDGGAQTVVANHMVAALMLMAIARVDGGAYEQCDCPDPQPQWTKVTFDVPTGTVQTSDVRLIPGSLDA